MKGFNAALRHSVPGDYVLATGRLHKVKDCLDLAFGHLGLDWHDYVVFDPKFSRPTDATKLIGDPCKAEAIFKWKPMLEFDTMVRVIVAEDFAGADARHTL